MKRSTSLGLLIAMAALLAPASAQATKTFSPTTLTFPATAAGKESAGQTVTFNIDAAEPAFSRAISPFISNPGGQACPADGFCAFRFTTTCPVYPALPPSFGAFSCSFTVFFKPDSPGKVPAELHANVGAPFVTLSGTATSGKKKCKKKKGGNRRAATVAKKCKKKKKR
jgi:hypothetical protein